MFCKIHSKTGNKSARPLEWTSPYLNLNSPTAALLPDQWWPTGKDSPKRFKWESSHQSVVYSRRTARWERIQDLCTILRNSVENFVWSENASAFGLCCTHPHRKLAWFHFNEFEFSRRSTPHCFHPTSYSWPHLIMSFPYYEPPSELKKFRRTQKLSFFLPSLQISPPHNLNHLKVRSLTILHLSSVPALASTAAMAMAM